MKTLAKDLAAYIECALWSSTGDDDKPLDSTHDADSFAPETMERFNSDWAAFQTKAGHLLDGLDIEQVAHDFWLTRNRHGGGFWDGDYPEPLGKQLTELAHSFGECDLYVGDDGKLYTM